MKKKDLLLDVDEVICFSGYLEAVNDFLNTNYTIDDFDCYYIDEKVIPKERFKEFNEYVSKRNLYDYTSFLPGAIETIKKLNEKYEIYICSACLNTFDLDNSGIQFKNKYDFLRKNLPFINPKKFILTSSKNMVKADIQIDDYLPNFDNDTKLKILFPSYHNKNIDDEILKEKNIIRAGYDWKTGWQEISKLLLENEND